MKLASAGRRTTCAFSDSGNPTLDTLQRVMKALGVRLAVAA
ncbi:MAG: hypothetical protein ACKVOL_11070 [Novosphingobium sp.]